MLRILTLLAASLLTAASAQAQDIAKYPERPVRVMVGFAPGSGPDIHARVVAQQLATDLGQPFIVENRLGANGTIAARAVATSTPDGYTILFSSSSIAPTQYMYKNTGYDLLTDLKPVATQGELDGIFMLVDSKFPVKTVPEFIEYAKKNHVLYGSPGVGNELHLKAELFNQMAGVKMEHVPYKGASEVMTGLLGGSVQVMFVTPPSVLGLLKDGRVRALAFTGTKPFPEFPDVPLISKFLPGYVQGSWGMFFVQGKTPDELVEKLNVAIHEALKKPAVADKLQRDGYFPDTRNAAETATFFKDKVKEVGGLVQAAGIEAN